MIRIVTFRTYFFLFAAGLLNLGAIANPQPLGNEEPPTIDVKFRCLGWRLSPQNPFEYYSQGEWVAIEDLNTFQRSRKPYHYIGPNPVVFYMRNPDGEPEPVAEVDFSDEYLEPLLLFTRLRRPDGDGHRYHALLFEDHDSVFPPGSFRFVNMTPMALYGKLGEKEFQLDSRRQLNITPGIESTQRAVFFLLATREESGELRALQSTYMQYDADTKHLTFVLPHPNGRGNVNTFTITERKSHGQDQPRTEP
ncbi:MAG: hypothetical protein LAT83_06015 [Kiritimatiellae bacterium]|nr:hypothetical protein [Kiritimatiellia bacterium]